MRVLDALLELVEQGELRPTAQAVAERAGVALRTVYHHFEDVGALRTMALTMQTDRYREMLREIDVKLPLEERIQQTARQYRRLFEAITPMRLATMFDQHDSPEMAEGLRQARATRRDHLSATFAPEVARRSEDGRSFLDGLDLVTSWDSWNYLRTSLNRSAVASEKVVILMITDLFTPGRRAAASRR